MTEVRTRQSILVVDNGAIDEALLQSSLVEKLQQQHIHLTVVRAQDGAKAFTKFANQKFDAVIVNTTVPRVAESGLDRSLGSAKSGFVGPLYVLGDRNLEAMGGLAKGKRFALPLDPQKLIEAVISDLSGSVKLAQSPPHHATRVENSSSFAVDVRVINAIITSTLKVLGQFGLQKIDMGKPSPRALTEPMGGVISSVLDIISTSFHGQLSISFDEGTFLEMVSGMLCEEQTAINDENRDAVGEINNIIFGNAKSDLASYGVQLSIPKVVQGAGQRMVCPEGSAALRVPFQTAKGCFFIDLIAYAG